MVYFITINYEITHVSFLKVHNQFSLIVIQAWLIVQERLCDHPKLNLVKQHIFTMKNVLNYTEFGVLKII